jgi:hypothetical protein
LVRPQESPVSQQAQQESPHTWNRAAGIVFVGFRVNWKHRLSDWEMNLRQAERWEGEFARWEVSGRAISLESANKEYFVRLADGVADFRCEGSAGFDQALRHASEIAGTLVKERPSASTFIETQFLVPRPASFDELRATIDAKLFKPTILRAVGATLMDCAYLVDTLIGGVFFQIHLGPVRKHELRQRLAVRTIREWPEVALFVSIVTAKPLQHGFDDLVTHVDGAIDVGNAVIREILT